MSTGYGIKTKLALGEQGVFGTAVARDAGLRVLEENLALKQERKTKAVLGAQSLMVTTKGKRGTEGGFKVIFPSKGGAAGRLLLKHGIGSIGSVTTELDDAAGDRIVDTYTLADLPAAGLSVEADRDAAAVGTAWLYDSYKINKLTLNQSMEEPLILGVEGFGRDEAKTAATGALTYNSLTHFDWEMISLTVNGVAFDTESFEISLENSLDNDNHKCGAGRLRKNIGRKEARKLGGKLEGEMESDVAIDLFRDLTEFAVVATWRGPQIGLLATVPVYRELVATMPRVSFTGETPSAKDAGRLKLSLPFVAVATEDTDNSELQLVHTYLGA